jgi:hypothetical protein
MKLKARRIVLDNANPEKIGHKDKLEKIKA